MARFYLDHDVSVRLAGQMIQAGHTAVTAKDRLLTRASDPVQLLTAAQDNAIFVTHNRTDFVLLHNAWLEWSRAWGVAQNHAGILVMEQVEFEILAEAIKELLDRQTSFPNELHGWRRRRGWTRL